MAEKHLTRITTRSVGPTPVRFSAVMYAEQLNNPGRKADSRQYTIPLEDDYPNLKLLKQTLPNPVLSYKGQDYYQALTNKLKMVKAGNPSHSLSYGFGEITEIPPNRRESPVIPVDEEAIYQRNSEASPERLHKQQSFGALPAEDNKLPQAGPKSMQTAKVEAKALSIIPRKSRRKADNMKKLPSLDDNRSGVTIFRKRNEPAFYEHNNNLSANGNESARMIHNVSAQKIKHSPFYTYVRCKSPGSLIGKYPRLRKESDFPYPVVSQISQPYQEVYSEIASKLLANKKVLTVNRDPSPIPIEYPIRPNEPQTPNMGRKATSSAKNAWELIREKTPENILAPLVISSMKKGTRNVGSPLKMRNEGEQQGFSKISLHELTSQETEQSEEENVARSPYKEGMMSKSTVAQEKLVASVVEEPEEKEERSSSEGDEEREREGKGKEEEGNGDVRGSVRMKKIENGHINGNNVKVVVGESSRKTTYVNTLKNNIGGNNANANAKKLGGNGNKQLSAAEQTEMKKLEVYREFLLKMNFCFNLQVKPLAEKGVTMYKFYLGKGNNHVMIRALMKTRWWWAQTDSKNPKDITFMWTQCRNKKYIESLPPREQDDKEESKGDSYVSSGYAMDLDPSLNGVVSDGMKRLFTKKEMEIMEGNAQGFKASVKEKDYEEACKKKFGQKVKVVSDPQNRRMCNHIEDNFHLANKKALLINMKNYYASIGDDVFKHLPLTFHIKNGLEDEEYHRFVECYKQREKEIQEQETDEKGKGTKKLRNIWIVKPGEDTNKGKGISLVNDISDVRELITGTKATHGSRTLLIQLYLDRPLLYNKRKFDIRCYMLISCINGVYRGYWYQEGYFRTSSKEFTLKNIANKQIHLTNDAIQKKYEEYGKWESGNKVSYSEFEKYLESTYGVDFYKTIYPKMKGLATDTMRAVYGTVDPYKRENTFEIFGLDFMIDSSYNVWLIEVNTNPDITIPSPKLAVLIPNMVENALRLTIDPLYPPPGDTLSKKQTLPENILDNNKFELVFDETEEGHLLKGTLKSRQEALNTLSPEDKEGEEENEEEAND